jgi:hypothetical protein
MENSGSGTRNSCKLGGRPRGFAGEISKSGWVARETSERPGCRPHVTRGGWREWQVIAGGGGAPWPLEDVDHHPSRLYASLISPKV